MTALSIFAGAGMSMPAFYIEAQTTEGGVHWQGYENHRTPSGVDRPYLRYSSNRAIPLEHLKMMVREGTPIFVDGKLATQVAWEAL